MSLSTAHALDDLLQSSTSDPYRQVPRAVVIVADAHHTLYSGSAGFAQLPPYGASAHELELAEKISEDSVFELWSCTKLVTVIAALQLVERGLLSLDDEIAKHVPEIKDVKVLRGFTESEEPILEENTVAPTVKMAADHTLGFSYQDEEKAKKYYQKFNVPKPYGPHSTGVETLAKMPFHNVPGEHWLYGTNNDWLSLVVEAVPLGIDDISFLKNPRKINLAETTEGSTEPYSVKAGTDFPKNKFWGGAGLLGSPKSYLKITQALLNNGRGANGIRILKKETVDLMFTPHLNAQQSEDLTAWSKTGSDPFTARLEKANPGVQWGYGGLLSPADLASGRKANSLTWSGYANTFWVVDRVTGITFVVFSNLIPYGHPKIFDMWADAETLIYSGLRA